MCGSETSPMPEGEDTSPRVGGIRGRRTRRELGVTEALDPGIRVNKGVWEKKPTEWPESVESTALSR
jgi:hypothetical protein